MMGVFGIEEGPFGYTENTVTYVEVSLNYCSQNGGNLYRAPYYNRNPNIGPRIDSNLGQSPCVYIYA